MKYADVCFLPEVEIAGQGGIFWGSGWAVVENESGRAVTL